MAYFLYIIATKFIVLKAHPIVSADSNDVNIITLKTDIAAGWVSDPNGRGTWDLLYSCLCTLLACVYTAIHLNIPPEGEGKIAGYGRKVKWILIALFAPEIVAYTAFEQSYLCHKFLKKLLIQEKINAENKSQDPRRSDLKMSYAHYAMMGGFAADVSHLHNVIKRVTFTTEEEIDDKSKQDSVGKAVVCLQGIWRIGQAIERKITGYPTTMLEVHTVVHVVCALALYTMWGNKPLDVGVPTMLDFRDKDEKYLAYMIILGSERGDRSLGLHPPKNWITDPVSASHNGFKIFNDTPDPKIEYDEPTFVMFQDIQAPSERPLVHQEMANSFISTPVMVGPSSEFGTTGAIKTIMHVDRSKEPLNDRSKACIAEEKPLVYVPSNDAQEVCTLTTGQSLTSGFGPGLDHRSANMDYKKKYDGRSVTVSLTSKDVRRLDSAAAYLKEMQTPLDKWDIFKTYYGDRCKGIVRFLINGTLFCSHLVRLILLYLRISAYVGARMYLMIGSSISLRHVPIGVYQTPNVNIMGNVPHI